MSCAELHAEPAAEILPLPAQAIVWQCAAGWEATLIGPAGLRWDEWRQQGLVHRVKHGNHRTVYRIDLPDRLFYLKHYHPEGWSAPLANLVRGSAARREWQNSLEVRRRNLPAAAPIALGEAPGALSRDSYFLSQAIENCLTLDDLAESVANPSGSKVLKDLALSPEGLCGARRRVIAALARLCAAAHQAGVEHADLHCGNVLVEWQSLAQRGNEQAAPRLYWIDLPKMRFSAPLSWRRSCDNLAMLAAAWIERTTRSEQLRFWNAYLAARPGLEISDSGEAQLDLVGSARSHARNTMANRDKRALATNRDFYRLTAGKRTAHAVRDVSPADLAAWLEDPERFVAAGWSTHFASQALVEWRQRNALFARRIATPRPLCVSQSRGLLAGGNGYLALEEAPGEPLDLRAAELVRNVDGAQAARRNCARAVGRLLGQLHDWRLTFPTAGAAAITVTTDVAEPAACVTTVRGIRVRKRFSYRQRADDLREFADSLIVQRVSTTDRLRALLAYLRAARLSRDSWKSLWRAADAGSILAEIHERRRTEDAAADDDPGEDAEEATDET